MNKKAKKLGPQISGGKSKKKQQVLTYIKEEDTKNDWGMIEDKEEIDFDNLMTEELARKEQERQKLCRDEEIAKRLREDQIRREEEALL